MLNDIVVQGVRKIRDANAARFDYDINAIIEDARRRQGALKERLVSFVKRAEKPNAGESKSSLPAVQAD